MGLRRFDGNQSISLTDILVLCEQKGRGELGADYCIFNEQNIKFVLYRVLYIMQLACPFFLGTRTMILCSGRLSCYVSLPVGCFLSLPKHCLLIKEMRCPLSPSPSPLPILQAISYRAAALLLYSLLLAQVAVIIEITDLVGTWNKKRRRII